MKTIGKWVARILLAPAGLAILFFEKGGLMIEEALEWWENRFDD